jgi:hypothetical protein
MKFIETIIKKFITNDKNILDKLKNQYCDIKITNKINLYINNYYNNPILN